MRFASVAAMILCLTLALSNTLFGQDKSSDEPQIWSGELDAGPVILRVLVKVKTAADGSKTAEFFSPDQTDQGFPIDDFTITEGKMQFKIALLMGQYKGTVDEAGTAVTGTWVQAGNSMLLNLEVIDAMPEKKLVETWKGTLQAGAQEFDFQIRIFSVSDRGQTAVLDSFSESAAGLAIVLDREGQKFNFKLPATAATYEGTLSDDGKSVEGIWKQSGGEYPLDFDAVELASTRDLTLKRPQTPKPPFKWKAIDVEATHQATNGTDVTIRGTLSLPQNVDRPPVVVLISGSGPQDRDCTIYEHKSFLVMADYFASRGIATLRYDDRGVGKSTGDFATATSEDFAVDVQSLVTMLRTGDLVDSERIALLGHSEGGLIAPIVASSMGTKIRCVVLLAGPSVNGSEIITSQSRRIMEVAGLKTDFLDFQEDVSNRLMNLALGKEDAIKPEEMDALKSDWAKVLEMASGTVADESGPQVDLKQAMAAFRGPWMRFFLAYDPAPKLRELNVPVLALFCENDLQVLPLVNLRPMEEALKEAPTKDVTVTTLPGLNHLFQHSDTGAPDQYVNIEETFSTDALKLIGDWMTGHFKR